MIRHIWLTFRKRTPETLRSHVIRVYWDDMDYPSVEAPLGDFFGLGHGRAADYSTPYLGVSDSRGFNCFFPMPFSKHCRITIENGLPEVLGGFYYQINYTLGNAVTQEMGRFHAHFNFMHISSGKTPTGRNFCFTGYERNPGSICRYCNRMYTAGTGQWREGEFRFLSTEIKRMQQLQGPASDWFCRDGDYILIRVFMLGVHTR